MLGRITAVTASTLMAAALAYGGLTATVASATDNPQVTTPAVTPAPAGSPTPNPNPNPNPNDTSW